jgi:hypothetical protein
MSFPNTFTFLATGTTPQLYIDSDDVGSATVYSPTNGAGVGYNVTGNFVNFSKFAVSVEL